MALCQLEATYVLNNASAFQVQSYCSLNIVFDLAIDAHSFLLMKYCLWKHVY